MTDFFKLANPNVLKLQAYVPGKTIEELRRESDVTEIIKVASNENPLGPSPLAIEKAATVLTSVNFYPDPNGYDLKQSLANKFNITTDKIILGNGSDSLLHYLGLTFINPGNEVIFSQYAFATFEIIARLYGGKPVIIPAKNWGNDLSAMAKAITNKTRLIYLANPNNPTGTWYPEDEFETFLNSLPNDVIVVSDEAYFEYMDAETYPNSLKLQEKYPNLVVTRTFSKAYGLAGIRIGYGIAHPHINQLLNRIRTPFGVSTPALAAAEAALADKAHLQRTLEVTQKGLQQLKKAFKNMGLECISEVGNFVTVDVKQNGTEVFKALLQKGIIVRPLANYNMDQFLRISVGTEQQNHRCLESLKEVLDL